MSIESKYSYLVRKTQKALGVFQKMREELQTLCAACEKEIEKCNDQKTQYDELIHETQELKKQEDNAIAFLRDQQKRVRSTSDKIGALFQ